MIKMSNPSSDEKKRTILPIHLDTLHKSSTGRRNVFDELELIAQRMNLKLNSDETKREFSFQHDCFSLKVVVADDGDVSNVILTQNLESKSCSELLEATKKGNYEDLGRHLLGLVSSYDIDGDKKVKTKAVQALQALESDLNMLSKFQSTIASVQSYIHKSPLGIVSARNIGLPMKLTYFVGPFDLLNSKSHSATPLTIEAIVDSDIGFSVTVGIESSSTVRRLQVMPLMTTIKNLEGKSLPSFGGLTSYNSALLAAHFVLQLKQPLVLSSTFINNIKQLTGIEFVLETKLVPILSLLMGQSGRGKRRKSTETDGHSATKWHSLVKLPDQRHRYFFESFDGFLQGALVSKIPFIHPTNVPSIIILLRQQLLFNTVLLSCLRKPKMQSMPPSDSFDEMPFEVIPISLQNISIAFEHPLKETLITVDLDLSDITSIKCKIVADGEMLICPDDYATRVMQRSLSLPILLRAIWRKALPELQKQLQLPHVNSTFQVKRLPKWRQVEKIKAEESKSSSLNESAVAVKDDEKLKRELLEQSQVLCNPVLASLLEQTSMNDDPNAEVIGRPAAPSESAPKQRKRLADSPVSIGFSPKRMVKEELGTRSPSGGAAVLPGPSVRFSLSSSVNIPPLGGFFAQSTKQDRFPPGRVDGTTAVFSSSLPGKDALMSKAQKMEACDVQSDVKPVTFEAHAWETVKKNQGRCSSLPTSLCLNQKMTEKQTTDQYSPVTSNPSSQIANNPELVSILSEPTVDVKRAKLPLTKTPELGGLGRIQDNRCCEVLEKVSASPSIKVTYSPSALTSGSFFSLNCGQRGHGTEMTDASQIKSNSKLLSFGNKMQVNAKNCNQRLRPSNFETSNNADAGGSQLTTSVEEAKLKAVDLEGRPKSVCLKVPKNCGKLNFRSHDLKLVGGQRIKDVPPVVLANDDEKLAKPPIRVKLSKRTLPRESSSLETVGAVTDIVCWKERMKEERQLHGSKLSLSLSDISSDIWADTEVDGLTSGVASSPKVIGVPSGRCSSSPRLTKPSNNGVKQFQVGEKRPRTEKTGLEMIEKKLKKSDDLIKKAIAKGMPNGGMSCSPSSSSMTASSTLLQATSTTSSSSSLLPSSTHSISASKISTIKITNCGGKLHIQNSLKNTPSGQGGKSLANSVRGFGSGSSYNPPHQIRCAAIPRGSKPPPSSVLLPKVVRPGNLSIHGINRSKPDAVRRTVNQKIDNKLSRTPTVKLKPISTGSASAVAVASATTVTSATPVQVKSSTKPATVGNSVGKNRSHTKGLLVVIDNLMKKQHSTSSMGSSVGDSGGAAVAQKELYDAIRLEIIREGNKPSTPTRENNSLAKTPTPQKKAEITRAADGVKSTSDAWTGSASAATTAAPSKTNSPLLNRSRNGLPGKTPEILSNRKASSSSSLHLGSSGNFGRKSASDCSDSDIIRNQPFVLFEPLTATDLPCLAIESCSSVLPRPLNPSSNHSLKLVDAPVLFSSQSTDAGIEVSCVSTTISSPSVSSEPDKPLPHNSDSFVKQQMKSDITGSTLDPTIHSRSMEVPDRHFLDAVTQPKPALDESDSGVERLLSPPQSPSPNAEGFASSELSSSVDGVTPIRCELKIVDFNKGSPITVEDSDLDEQLTDSNGNSSKMHSPNAQPLDSASLNELMTGADQKQMTNRNDERSSATLSAASTDTSSGSNPADVAVDDAAGPTQSSIEITPSPPEDVDPLPGVSRDTALVSSESGTTTDSCTSGVVNKPVEAEILVDSSFMPPCSSPSSSPKFDDNLNSSSGTSTAMTTAVCDEDLDLMDEALIL